MSSEDRLNNTLTRIIADIVAAFIFMLTWNSLATIVLGFWQSLGIIVTAGYIFRQGRTEG